MKKMNKKQFLCLYKSLRKDGELSTSQVLEMASDESSPLHSLFEWDDAKAAKAHRLSQARNIIKGMNIYFEKAQEKIVHVPSAYAQEGVYKQNSVVVLDIDDFHLALDQLLKLFKPIKRAIDDLEQAAKDEAPETTALLAMAMRGFNTVEDAINRLH